MRKKAGRGASTAEDPERREKMEALAEHLGQRMELTLKMPSAEIRWTVEGTLARVDIRDVELKDAIGAGAAGPAVSAAAVAGRLHFVPVTGAPRTMLVPLRWCHHFSQAF